MKPPKEDGFAAGEIKPCPFCGDVMRLVRDDRGGWHRVGHTLDKKDFCPIDQFLIVLPEWNKRALAAKPSTPPLLCPEIGMYGKCGLPAGHDGDHALVANPPFDLPPTSMTCHYCKKPMSLDDRSEGIKHWMCWDCKVGHTFYESPQGEQEC